MRSLESRYRKTESRTTISRSGFSLLEVLVVLAVLVMITALAMPAMNSVFSGQHLRSAADVVRARFAEARVKSIETGDVHGFFYMPTQGNYFVAPMTEGFRTMQSGVQPSVQQRMLENEIVFAAGESMQDTRSVYATNLATNEYSIMKPVLFYPDGTSQDATVILQNKRGAVIQINLRGLTGTASKTRILDRQEVLK
ncbi:MAG: prepilin-type N-terminal cleavage/methylation domain-containing protein [Pirellulaceae bacterium]